MKLENGGRIEIQGEISEQSEIAAVISTDGGETEAEIQQTARRPTTRARSQRRQCIWKSAISTHCFPAFKGEKTA